MQIICVDTNATVGGVGVPVGAFTFPMQGTMEVRTSGGIVTNLTLGSGDTLCVGREAVTVFTGIDVWAMFLLGLFVSVALHGLLCMARRMASFLSGGRVREV